MFEDYLFISEINVSVFNDNFMDAPNSLAGPKQAS